VNELFIESTNFNLPHLHLAPRWVTLLEFRQDFWHQKTKVSAAIRRAVYQYHILLVACCYNIENVIIR